MLSFYPMDRCRFLIRAGSKLDACFILCHKCTSPHCHGPWLSYWTLTCEKIQKQTYVESFYPSIYPSHAKGTLCHTRLYFQCENIGWNIPISLSLLKDLQQTCTHIYWVVESCAGGHDFETCLITHSSAVRSPWLS